MNSIKCPNCGKYIDPMNEVCTNCWHILHSETNNKQVRKSLFTKKDYLIMLGCTAGIATTLLIICLLSSQFVAAGIFGFIAFVFIALLLIVLFNIFQQEVSHIILLMATSIGGG